MFILENMTRDEIINYALVEDKQLFDAMQEKFGWENLSTGKCTYDEIYSFTRDFIEEHADF